MDFGDTPSHRLKGGLRTSASANSIASFTEGRPVAECFGASHVPCTRGQNFGQAMAYAAGATKPEYEREEGGDLKDL
jgi:hypothetical protein